MRRQHDLWSRSLGGLLLGASVATYPQHQQENGTGSR